MDPYEKLLSPRRTAQSKSSTRLRTDMIPSVASTSGSASKIATARAAKGRESEGEESGKGVLLLLHVLWWFF